MNQPNSHSLHDKSSSQFLIMNTINKSFNRYVPQSPLKHFQQEINSNASQAAKERQLQFSCCNMRGLNKKAKTLFKKVEIDGVFEQSPSGMSGKLTEQTQELNPCKYDRILQALHEKPGGSTPSGDPLPERRAQTRYLKHDVVSVPTAAEHLPTKLNNAN